MKTVTVVVAEDGSIKIEAAGFSGGSCDQATKFLEDVLGDVTEKTRTAEYYKKSVVTQQQISR